MNPDQTIPATAMVDPRDWFVGEEREYLLAEKAKREIGLLIDQAIREGDARARQDGIRGLKRFLGTPDELDKVLEVFCYGRTLELRKKAGEQLTAWMKSEHGEAEAE
jgi:hypothetical protein